MLFPKLSYRYCIKTNTFLSKYINFRYQIMSRVLFYGAFLVTGTPMVFWLANKDPEPDMAFLSLLIFCFVGGVTSLLAYILSFKKLPFAPSKLNSLSAGGISSAIFFLTLSFVSEKFDLWPCLLLALILSALFAAIFPFITNNGVRHD
jgi:hypothetical protein